MRKQCVHAAQRGVREHTLVDTLTPCTAADSTCAVAVWLSAGVRSPSDPCLEVEASGLDFNLEPATMCVPKDGTVLDLKTAIVDAHGGDVEQLVVVRANRQVAAAPPQTHTASRWVNLTSWGLAGPWLHCLHG